MKKRIILDLKKSGVSKRTCKTYKVVLPRLSGLVQDSLDLLDTKEARQYVEVFVLDFANAFWQISLAPAERRHVVVPITGNIDDQLRVLEWPTLLDRTFVVTHAVHTGSLHRHVPGCDQTRMPHTAVRR